MNNLHRLFSGSLPLTTAFWGFLIGGGLVLLVATSVVGGLSVFAYPSARVPLYVAAFFVLWAYLLIVGFGTWRSASATETGSLRIVAKVVLILLAVWFLFSLSNHNGVIAMLRGTWQPGSYLRDTTK